MLKNKLFGALFALGLFGCSSVGAGYAGVKVYTLGSERGDIEILGTGRYWIGMNEELYLFPLYQQNYTWIKPEKGNAPDESITFQTIEGMQVNADMGISFTVQKDKLEKIFTTYRRGVEEITDTFLRNHVRDALNAAGSKLTVESVYGSGKTDLMAEVKRVVKDKVEPIGIQVDEIYLIGSFRLPPQIVEALNNKMAATQRAQQRENEVAEATAEANKAVAKSKGEAESARIRAEQEALSKVITAEAEAKANRVLAESLSQNLIEYERVKKWNGQLPTTALGSNTSVLLSK